MNTGSILSLKRDLLIFGQRQKYLTFDWLTLQLVDSTNVSFFFNYLFLEGNVVQVAVKHWVHIISVLYRYINNSRIIPRRGTSVLKFKYVNMFYKQW